MTEPTSIALAYLDEDDQLIYLNMDQPDKDNFDDFVNELEHYMIQLQHLLYKHDALPIFKSLLGSISDNVHDIAFDPLFTDQEN